MNDTDLLRDLLEQAAPDRPEVDPTSRAAAVARRGRNARVRDRALVAAAAVAVVVAAAVPFATSDRSEETSYPTTTPPVAVEPCPAEPVDSESLGPVTGVGELEAARSCLVVIGDGRPSLPTEPLVGDAAQAFADDLAALPAWTMPSFCMVANVAPDPWALQLQTVDGLATLGSTMRICSSVSVDGRDLGVDQVVAAFEGNLAGVPDSLACPSGDRLADGAPTWNASFDPATATAGVVCYRTDPLGEQDYAGTEATLTDDQLAVIRDDLAANLGATVAEGGCTDTGPQRSVVLMDGDGDQAAWVDDYCYGEFAGARGYWTPSQAAEQVFTDALTG